MTGAAVVELALPPVGSWRSGLIIPRMAARRQEEVSRDWDIHLRQLIDRANNRAVKISKDAFYRDKRC